MNPKEIKIITDARDNLAKILTNMIPANNDEWQAFEQLTSIHKSLRGLDIAKLSQQTMDMVQEPENPQD
ncbi:MAG: hypothetical protein A2158_01635 [Chloroflexi bacterium RBG_13_46_14]|nr:MAG: hypothetical protein A2158_01635 [Chloroflexi bacterium RBG_13_46_14]